MNDSHDVKKAMRMLHRICLDLEANRAFEDNKWEGDEFRIEIRDQGGEVRIVANGVKWCFAIDFDRYRSVRAHNAIRYVHRRGNLNDILAAFYAIVLSL